MIGVTIPCSHGPHVLVIQPFDVLDVIQWPATCYKTTGFDIKIIYLWFPVRSRGAWSAWNNFTPRNVNASVSWTVYKDWVSYLLHSTSGRCLVVRCLCTDVISILATCPWVLLTHNLGVEIDSIPSLVDTTMGLVYSTLSLLDSPLGLMDITLSSVDSTLSLMNTIMSLVDSSPGLVDITLSLVDSTLSLVDSTLALVNSILSLVDSSLSLVDNILGFKTSG